MKTPLFGSLALAALIISAAPVKAHIIKEDNKTAHDHFITMAEAENAPKTKNKKTQDEAFTGPKESKGIKQVLTKGYLPLKGEFKDINNRTIRLRTVEIEPGGVVALHLHAENPGPGVAYIISGELTEYKKGAGGPVVRKAGDAAFEEKGTLHWWKNHGKVTAKVVVFDLLALDKK